MFRLIFSFLFVTILAAQSYAAIDIVNGEWETTFNCPEWAGASRTVPATGPLDCDGLDTGLTLDYQAEITTDANNPAGVGRGSRHWLKNSDSSGLSGSGGIKISLSPYQHKFWLRWYNRWEADKWKSSEPWGSAKIFWMKRDNYISFILPSSNTSIGSLGFSPTDPKAISYGTGWGVNFYPSGTSDGSWVCFELMVDILGGKATYWVNDKQVASYDGLTFNNTTGPVEYIMVGSNSKYITNGPKYMDYDDIKLSLNGPIGCLGSAPITCSDDPSRCTSEAECTTNWPAYNWCTDSNTCQEAACAITRTLVTGYGGTGSGTVSSDIGAINCPGKCSDYYDNGSIVTLTATPDQYSSFASWTGCDSASSNVCTMTMDADKTVTAIFDNVDAPECDANNFLYCYDLASCTGAGHFWWDESCHTITEPTDWTGDNVLVNDSFDFWTGNVPEPWELTGAKAGVNSNSAIRVQSTDTLNDGIRQLVFDSKGQWRFVADIRGATDQVEVYTYKDGSQYFSTTGSSITGIVSWDDEIPDQNIYFQAHSGVAREVVVDRVILKQLAPSGKMIMNGVYSTRSN